MKKENLQACLTADPRPELKPSVFLLLNMRWQVAFLIIMFLLGGNIYAQSNKDSLRNIIETTDNDSLRIEALFSLTRNAMWSNPDSARLICDSILGLLDELDGNKDRTETDRITTLWFRATVYYRYGAIAKIQANFPKAMSAFLEVLKIQEQMLKSAAKMGSAKWTEIAKSELSGTYNNIGLIYSEEGNYPRALDYYFKCLTLATKRNLPDVKAGALGNIGIIYFRMEDFPRALEFYDQAMEISEQLENKRHMATWNMCIGVIHEIQDEAELAQEYYSKATQLAEAIDDKSRLAGILTSRGNLYIAQEKYDEALTIVLQSLQLGRDIGSMDDVASSQIILGHIYTKKEEYVLSEYYLDSGLTLAIEIGSLPFTQEAHEGLSRLYEETGRYKESYEHYIEFTYVKDSLFNEDKSKEVGKLEAKFEFEKSEEEKKRVEEKRRVTLEAAESRRNNLQYSGILIFLVALVGGVLMLGKLSIPLRLAEGLIFFTFLLFFEFSLVLLDPFIEQFSGGEPAYKLLFNAVLAAMIFPLHSFFEEKIKVRLLSSEDQP